MDVPSGQLGLNLASLCLHLTGGERIGCPKLRGVGRQFRKIRRQLVEIGLRPNVREFAKLLVFQNLNDGLDLGLVLSAYLFRCLFLGGERLGFFSGLVLDSAHFGTGLAGLLAQEFLSRAG